MSELLAGAGVLLAAAASATAILLPPGRLRSAAMLLAIALVPVLVAGDQWHTTQIEDLRGDSTRIAFLLGVAAVATGALATAYRRWPKLLPLAIVFALPFRVPLHAGGDTANLLVPLYLVIAAGVVAAAVRDWNAPSVGGAGNGRGVAGERPPFRFARQAPPTGALLWLPRLLAAFVVLYALQTLYSQDFSEGLQNVCFFLAPFTVAYALLRDCEWDRWLLTAVLVVVGIEAAVFVGVGTVEYLTRDLFWNDQVIRSNEFHTYFRVNSVFWDPNVYGRYLSLVIVVATTALLWARERRDLVLLSALIGVLWFGLAVTFSQSSFLALLAGLAVLAALRWSWRWTLAAVVAGAIGAVLVVLLAGGSPKVRINIDTSGRANLVSGGLDLFADRPLQGYGSGAFQDAYRDSLENKDVPVAVSHTEPVTIASEQGLLGIAIYLALIAVAIRVMASGLFAPRAGGTGEGGVEDAPARRAPPSPVTGPARRAVLAAFVALLVHTMAYAGFFEDPITWVLLAVGASLASAPAVREPT
ncbi:MAG TPA: O-antigen ligase family protein [Solirubrobacterales bacterium]|nr:O-antigen ligase family protein [Solirubrobacterales bacterium]